jgi:hypothetical protein
MSGLNRQMCGVCLMYSFEANIDETSPHVPHQDTLLLVILLNI